MELTKQDWSTYWVFKLRHLRKEESIYNSPMYKKTQSYISKNSMCDYLLYNEKYTNLRGLWSKTSPEGKKGTAIKRNI